MKVLSILPILLIAVALTACAGPQARNAAPGDSVTSAQQYIAAVNQEAQRTGVRVIWVNPPDDRNTSVSYSSTMAAEDNDDDRNSGS